MPSNGHRTTLNGARPGNLFEPTDMAADDGTHGRFDAQAHARSQQAWLSRHRWLTGAGAGAALVTAIAATRASR